MAVMKWKDRELPIESEDLELGPERKVPVVASKRQSKKVNPGDRPNPNAHRNRVVGALDRSPANEIRKNEGKQKTDQQRPNEDPTETLKRGDANGKEKRRD